MRFIRRLYWTWSIWRECNRTGAEREFWTGKPAGRVTLATAWAAAEHIGQYQRQPEDIIEI